MPKIVIVGMGIGGLGAAFKSLKFVPDAKITLIGDELPYVRHKLRLVTQGIDIKVRTSHIESEVEIIQGRVTKVKREQKEVVLENGETIPYDYLILATGSHPSRSKRIKGSDKALGFRRLEDVQKLIDESPSEVAIIGASFVALHVADAARGIGAKPYVIVRSRVMRKALEPELSEEIQNRLAEKGVEFVKGTPKEVKDGAVVLDDGREVKADLIYIATGVDPNIALAKQIGLDLYEGWVINADQHGRTSDPNIFAVGDNAIVHDFLTGKPMYLGIGTAASIMSLNAARAIAGHKAAMRVPRYQKDVFFGGIHMTSVGLTSVEAQKEGFDADRVEVSGNGWGDKAYIVYDKKTKRVLGFSAVSKDDVKWKSIDVLLTMMRRQPITRLGIEPS